MLSNSPALKAIYKGMDGNCGTRAINNIATQKVTKDGNWLSWGKGYFRRSSGLLSELQLLKLTRLYMQQRQQNAVHYNCKRAMITTADARIVPTVQ